MVIVRAKSSTMRISLPPFLTPARTALLKPEEMAIAVYHQAGTKARLPLSLMDPSTASRMASSKLEAVPPLRDAVCGLGSDGVACGVNDRFE